MAGLDTSSFSWFAKAMSKHSKPLDWVCSDNCFYKDESALFAKRQAYRYSFFMAAGLEGVLSGWTSSACCRMYEPGKLKYPDTRWSSKATIRRYVRISKPKKEMLIGGILSL